MVKQVKHPYITIDRKIKGGEPVIAGTGIRVLDIAVLIKAKKDLI